MKKYMKWIKWFLLLLLVSSVVYWLNKSEIFQYATPEQLRDFIASYKVLAPFVYILLFTFVPLTLFPDSVLAISGGMCFGLFWGFVYTMIGAVCGGTLAFYLSRGIGRKLVKTFSKKEADKLSTIINERGFIIVLMLRLIPLFPFDVISYGAGVSNIKYRDYLLATIVGIIPGVLVFTNIGTQVSKIGSFEFYISISMLVLLVVCGNLFKDKLKVSMKS